MKRITSLLVGMCLPFVYMYTLVRMIVALPKLLIISIRLRSPKFISLGIANTGAVVAMLVGSIVQAILLPVLYVAGGFISAMGEISGILAFSLIIGFSVTMYLSIPNMYDAVAIIMVLTACSTMALVGIILWASNGEDYEDEAE